MNRKENKEIKTKKIIKIATRLFINQGYENTNVRQILSEAGISTGSLYNFFKNKEDILLSVFKDIGKEVIALSKEISNDFDEPVLGNFVGVATEKIAMLESRRIKNIYRFIWSVKSVKDFVLPLRVRNAKEILKSFKLDFTEEEIYARVIASMGVERALVEAIIDGSIKITPEEVWTIQTRMYLASFGVSGSKINRIIKDVLEILENSGNSYKKAFIRRLAKTNL